MIAIVNFVIACVIIVLVYNLIRFLFDNFIISRIISIGLCGYLIYETMITAPEDRIDGIIGFVIFSVLAWLFYRGGDQVFDLEETGWVTVFSDGTEERETTGGFIRHFIASAVVFFLIYFFIGSSLPIVFHLAPVVILGLNIASLYLAFSES